MKIREASKNDLPRLLKLYMQLHDNSMPDIDNSLYSLWKRILDNKDHHIILGIIDEKIISSCVLVVIPNLTHNQRPYALVENVITDENYRKKGYATAILQYAKEIAQKENCYKIMLLTGSKQESTLKFYEQAGYNKNDKTAFIQWIL
jgi:GNAT superfamily N-acetyltransferase